MRKQKKLSSRQKPLPWLCKCRSAFNRALRQLRGHGDQFGRGARPRQQATKVHGALWRISWRTWSYLTISLTEAVNFGSELSCLRNGLRQPIFLSEATDNVEAYHFQCDYGAASVADLDRLNTSWMTRCHSIHWEPTFLSEPAALATATILLNEVLPTLDPLQVREWPQLDSRLHS